MARKFNKDGRLPLTRKQQICYLISNEFGMLFLTNLITFIFVIPLLLCFFFFVLKYHQVQLASSIGSNDYFNIFLMYGLLFIPAFLIASIGFTGQYSYTKQIVFNSTGKFSSYWKGIKDNFKSVVGYYMVFGILIGLLVVNIGFSRYIPYNDVVKIILLIANCLLILTMFIARTYAGFESVTFNNSMFAYIRNGVYMFYKCLPLSLINLLLLVAPFVLVAFVPIKVFFIPLGIFATFYFSISTLIIFIISLMGYEKVIPQENISEIYHKGLEDVNF